MKINGKHKLVIYSFLAMLFIMVVIAPIRIKTTKYTGKIPEPPSKQLKLNKPELISKEIEKPTETHISTPAGFSSNEAKLYIYNKESGNKPTARNAGGCLGLGQACPGSKLLAVCPDLNDYACQDAFFTNYAMKRYGSWENAKAFWLAHHWW